MVFDKLKRIRFARFSFGKWFFGALIFFALGSAIPYNPNKWPIDYEDKLYKTKDEKIMMILKKAQETKEPLYRMNKKQLEELLLNFDPPKKDEKEKK